MDKELFTRILQVTVVVVVLLLFIFLFIGIDIFSFKGISKLPSIVSLVVLFWAFYISFGWKWPILKLLAYKENLNGTWFGTYTSINVMTKEKFEGQIAVVIRQTFIMINVKSYTSNYVNHSYGEVLNYNNKSDTNQLIYLYSQNEYNPTSDDDRKGTSELQLNYSNKKKGLFGKFWTNHNSQGHVNLSKLTRKQLKSFDEALIYSTK